MLRGGGGGGGGVREGTCWKSWEITDWKRSTTMGLGGGGPCPAQTCSSPLLVASILRSGAERR